MQGNDLERVAPDGGLLEVHPCRQREDECPGVLHMLNDVVPKLGTFDLSRALHEPGKIIRDAL